MELYRRTISIPKKPSKDSTASSTEYKIIESNEAPVMVPVEGILLDILSKIYEERNCG